MTSAPAEILPDHEAATEWAAKYVRHTNPWGNLARCYLDVMTREMSAPAGHSGARLEEVAEVIQEVRDNWGSLPDRQLLDALFAHFHITPRSPGGKS